MTVDVASIEGGMIPFEPTSLRYPLATHADRRYLKDEETQYKTQNSLKILKMLISSTTTSSTWPVVWGASYDLGYSEVLGEKLTQANAEGILLGSVC